MLPGERLLVLVARQNRDAQDLVADLCARRHLDLAHVRLLQPPVDKLRRNPLHPTGEGALLHGLHARRELQLDIARESVPALKDEIDLQCVLPAERKRGARCDSGFAACPRCSKGVAGRVDERSFV